eukprot:g4171.t1
MSLRRTTRLLGRMDGYKYNKNGPKPFSGTQLWWKSYVPVHGERHEHLTPFRSKQMTPMLSGAGTRWYRRVREHWWKFAFFFGTTGIMFPRAHRSKFCTASSAIVPQLSSEVHNNLQKFGSPTTHIRVSIKFDEKLLFYIVLLSTVPSTIFVENLVHLLYPHLLSLLDSPKPLLLNACIFLLGRENDARIISSKYLHQLLLDLHSPPPPKIFIPRECLGARFCMMGIHGIVPAAGAILRYFGILTSTDPKPRRKLTRLSQFMQCPACQNFRAKCIAPWSVNTDKLRSFPLLPLLVTQAACTAALRT